MKHTIPVELLRQHVKYDPETGALTRLTTHARGRAGTVVTGTNVAGYIQLSVCGVFFYGHHVAWALHTGHWPKQLDHINGVKNDNRIANLREASNAENRRNQGKNRKNTSGFRGVSLDKRSGKYVARISVDNDYLSLGYFQTKEEAYEAYLHAASLYHDIFAHG